MNDDDYRRRKHALNAARVLDVLGSHCVGPGFPCGQHFSLGCALTCESTGPCPEWSPDPCWGPPLLAELKPH